MMCAAWTRLHDLSGVYENNMSRKYFLYRNFSESVPPIHTQNDIDNTDVQHTDDTDNELDRPMYGASTETSAEICNMMDVASLPQKGPQLPTSCCMSGCANCVWIEYVEELARYYKDGGDKAKEAIRRIPDHNLRAFLEIELRFK